MRTGPLNFGNNRVGHESRKMFNVSNIYCNCSIPRDTQAGKCGCSRSNGSQIVQDLRDMSGKHKHRSYCLMAPYHQVKL